MQYTAIVYDKITQAENKMFTKYAFTYVLSLQVANDSQYIVNNVICLHISMY